MTTEEVNKIVYFQCPKCNGSKIDEKTFNDFAKYLPEDILKTYGLYLYCKHCKGHGFVDWINNATGQPREDEVEDYDRDEEDIYDIIALIKLDLINLDIIDLDINGNHYEKLIEIMQECTDPNFTVCKKLELEEKNIMKFDITDYKSQGVIPNVTITVEKYIVKCIEYTIAIYIISRLNNILEEGYHCVNPKQVTSALKYCKYLGIEIGKKNCHFESIDDAIDWCADIVYDCDEHEENDLLCGKIQEAFNNVSQLHLTKSEKNELGIISFEDS